MYSIKDLYKFPIVGLSPMDGITDVAFREITKKYGKPDVLFTEFVHVMGLCFAAQNLLKTLEYTEFQRPIIAQIFGKEPEYFYHAAKIVCALGFDGVDINMGCPASSVASKGAGAALINTPDIALAIIAETKRGVADWVADGKLTGLRKEAQKAVEQIKTRNIKRLIKQLPNTRLPYALSWGQQNLIGERTQIPVTVKTRIGYDTPVTTEWIKTLSQAKPEWISVHGRTLKQMYTGEASWDELKKAVESTDIPVLTNGDIKVYEDIGRMLEFTKSSGVLVGRGSFGNPFVFTSPPSPLSSNYLEKGEITESSLDTAHLTPKHYLERGKSTLGTPHHTPSQYLERGESNLVASTPSASLQYFKGNISLWRKVMLEHAEIFVKFNPDKRAFVQMRKHLGWYAKNMQAELKGESIKELKMKLVRVESMEELKKVVNFK